MVPTGGSERETQGYTWSQFKFVFWLQIQLRICHLWGYTLRNAHFAIRDEFRSLRHVLPLAFVTKRQVHGHDPTPRLCAMPPPEPAPEPGVLWIDTCCERAPRPALTSPWPLLTSTWRIYCDPWHAKKRERLLRRPHPAGDGGERAVDPDQDGSDREN